MNEEISNRRLLLIAGLIAVVMVLILVMCGINAVGNADKTPDTANTTTTAAAITTSTSMLGVDDAVGTTTATTTAADHNSTTAREDRYDFKEATTTQPLRMKNCYEVDIEFDGWQLYLSNAEYDETTRTLSFNFRQVCTRKNAQPIYYEIVHSPAYSPDRVLVSSEKELPQPSLPIVYYSLDHLQAREFRVTVEDVDPDYGVLFIDLETMSVPDDDTAVNGGTIITESLYLQQQQIPCV